MNKQIKRKPNNPKREKNSMSDIEELIGRYLVLSQKSDSTLNIFFFHQRAGQALLPRLKIANKQTFLKRANQNFRNSKKIFFSDTAPIH